MWHGKLSLVSFAESPSHAPGPAAPDTCASHARAAGFSRAPQPLVFLLLCLSYSALLTRVQCSWARFNSRFLSG